MGYTVYLTDSNLEEFLVHGIKFAFVPERGEMTRGLPTAYAAVPLNSVFLPDGEPPPVWPDPQGEVRGMVFSPLYKSAPKAAQLDPALYELLVLVDAIRGGRARERAFAIKALQQRLKTYEQNAESRQFIDAVSGHMPADAMSQARVPIILDRIAKLAENK